jgi:hypothetical protein
LARWQLEALLVLAYGKAHWKTAGVSFHENFWLAASAAAPVITLAIVVAIPDAANMRFRAAGAMRAAEGQRRVSEVSGPHDRPSRDSARDRTGESLRATRWAVQVTRWNVRLCYANLIAQAVLLAVSLAALAYGLDLVPPWLAIVVAVGGVGRLAWTLLRGAGIRDGVERAIRLAPSGDGYQYPGPGWGGAVDR